MKKKNVIFLIFTCFIITCNNSTHVNTEIVAQYLNDVTYFHPTIQLETKISGESKDGIRLNSWSYQAGKSVDFTINWKYYSIDNLNLMLPASFIIEPIQGKESAIYKLNDSNDDYELYVFNSTSELKDESSKSQYLLDEMIGVMQVCIEDERCEIGKKNANYFEFQNTHLIIFSYEEIIPDNSYLRLGGLVLRDDKMYYLTSKTINKEEDILRNKMIFSEIFNHIKFNNKNVVSISLELLKAEPIAFTD